MTQPNVTRAIQYLVARNLLRVDEETGGLYPVPKPHLSPELRTHISTDMSSDDIDDWLPSIPQKYRKAVASLLEEAPVHISTEMEEGLSAACTAFNEGLKDLRTKRDQAIETARLKTPPTRSRAKPRRRQRQPDPPLPSKPTSGTQNALRPRCRLMTPTWKPCFST